jgi:glucosamine-6-phosphate deaminase
MRLIIRPNSESVADWVSRYVMKRIKDFAPTAEVRRSPLPLSSPLPSPFHPHISLVIPPPSLVVTHRMQRPFVLGLPTGSTPLKTYEALIRLHKRGDVRASLNASRRAFVSAT